MLECSVFTMDLDSVYKGIDHTVLRFKNEFEII